MSDSDKFIPELHDIGKLVDRKNCKYMISHYFNIEELKKDGISVPQNKTFEGIQKHHCGEKNPYCNNEKQILNDLDIVLLIMADHFASGFSRLDETTKKEVNIKAEDKSVYKLWNKSEQKDIKDKFISCTKGHIETILDTVAKNDCEDLLSKYNELLEVIPEDKMPLFNVISLKTHLTLVGKVFRFLKSQVENFDNGKIKFYGDKPRSFTGVKAIENTAEFKVVFASISMPKFIARVNDLSFFEILDEQLNRLRQENQVLFVSPEAFLFICNKEEKVENIRFIKELINLGFRLKTKEVINSFSELEKLPQELVNNEINDQNEKLKKILQNEGIPEDRKEERKRAFTENYGKFYHIYEVQKPEEIKNLCDICQQNEAISYNELTDEEKKLVTKEEDGKKIIESLCKYCINIRKEYEKSGNLKPFAKWEEEIPRPDALWVKVSLDVDNLIKALKVNYEEYIDDVLKNNHNLAEKVKNRYELRYTWISEFLEDYNRFLEEFYESIKSITDVILIKKDFFVAKNSTKNSNLKHLKDIVTDYYNLFMKYFHDFSDIKNDGKHPITFTLINSNVKSPLMEIWRNITVLNKKPVKLILKNKNIMEINFNSLDYLVNNVDIFQTNISSFLHKLAKMYEQSGSTIIPLTEIFNERCKYENIYKGIKEKGLSATDIINWYRMVKVENGEN